METFPIEVVAHIFEYVRDTSPPTAASIILVNRRWANIYLELVHGHHVRIDISNDETYTSGESESLVQKVYVKAADPAIIRNLRILTIAGDASCAFPPPGHVQWRIHAAVATLIIKTKQLESLEWNVTGTPSNDVLNALHSHHPQAALHISDYLPDTRSLRPTQNVLSLATSPALRSFGCNTQWHLGEGDTRQAAFHYIVSRAPNLDLVKALNHVDSQIEPDIYRQLQESFPLPSHSRRTVKNLVLEAYRISEATLIPWRTIIDLSNLTGLHILSSPLDPDTIDFIIDTCTHLSCLSLNLRLSRREPWPPFNTAVRRLLRSCSQLKYLSLWSWSHAVSLHQIIEEHGPSLEYLALHDRDFWQDWAPVPERRYLSPDELQLLLTNCPSLRSLTLDHVGASLNLGLRFPKGFASHVSLLMASHLHTLQIYLDGNMDLQRHVAEERRKDPSIPLLDDAYRTWVDALWQSIFGRKRIGRRKLVVKIGEWERYDRRRRQGLRAGFPHASWKFEVEPNERDDKVDECQITMEKIESI